jgi:hypothetical protein
MRAICLGKMHNACRFVPLLAGGVAPSRAARLIPIPAKGAR